MARAGLFHALHQGRAAGREKRVLATMSPKEKPLQNLALHSDAEKFGLRQQADRGNLANSVCWRHKNGVRKRFSARQILAK